MFVGLKMYGECFRFEEFYTFMSWLKLIFFTFANWPILKKNVDVHVDSYADPIVPYFTIAAHILVYSQTCHATGACDCLTWLIDCQCALSYIVILTAFCLPGKLIFDVRRWLCPLKTRHEMCMDLVRHWTHAEIGWIVFVSGWVSTRFHYKGSCFAHKSCVKLPFRRAAAVIVRVA